MNKSKKDVKETSEKLLIQIIEYITKCNLEEKEEKELLREMACSLITASIDIDKSIKELAVEIDQTCHDVRDICFVGLARFKSGDESNAKRIWRNKGGDC